MAGAESVLVRVAEQVGELEVVAVIGTASGQGHDVVDGCREWARGRRSVVSGQSSPGGTSSMARMGIPAQHDWWPFHWVLRILADPAQPVVSLTDLDALSKRELPPPFSAAVRHVFEIIVGRSHTWALLVLGEASPHNGQTYPMGRSIGYRAP
jgi:hypothetical protein